MKNTVGMWNIDKSSDDPCHTLACKIQGCLAKNNFNQNQCEDEMRNYNECVKKFAEKEKQKQLTSTSTTKN